MAGWEIVRRVEEPDRYAPCAAAVVPDEDAAPWSELGRRLFPTFFPPGSLVDASFALCYQQRPIALIEAVLDPACRLTRHGEPLRIALTPHAGALCGPAVDRVLDYLIGEATSLPHRPDFLEVEDLDVTGLMTPIGLAVMKRGGQPALVPWPMLDLRQPDAALWQAVRPSYRTKIYWGQRHLGLVHFNRAAPDPAVFEMAVAFLTAQGTVLSTATASFFRDIIAAGQGEATLILFESRLIGCIFILEEAGTGFYGAAAYDAEASEPGGRRPSVGHWPLWEAIRRCRSRGCRRFELYRVFFRGQERPGYRFGVAHFKLGFTDTVRQRIVWRLPLEAK